MTDRIELIGAKVNVGSFDSAIDAVASQSVDGGGGYICFVNAHVAVFARQDSRIRSLIDDSFRSFPDGRSLHWLGNFAVSFSRPLNPHDLDASQYPSPHPKSNTKPSLRRNSRRL